MTTSNICDSTTQDDSELPSPMPPSTPPRGRSRYPDSLARVPLHRRGTSKTYERLEDLLREAGYKETRVFTPESERHVDRAHERSVRGGVGAVVGFLAGLVTRNSSLSREAESQPPSPLAQVKALQASSSTSSYSFNTSPESLRKHSRFHATRRDTLAQPTHYMRHQSSSNFAPAPNAHAYLRHMASAPNIQPLLKRPSSSNVSLRSHAQPRSSRRALLLSADDIIETEDPPLPPPLPHNWMETIAKALLAGVVPDTASSRKTSSTLSAATNTPREPRRPPLLCAQVREQRASTSEGKVSQTSVVCRSAPGSRAGSRVRRTIAEDEESRRRRDGEGRRKGKGKWEEEPRKGKGKRKESDMVPSLARTRVENDEWSMRRYLPPANHGDIRQASSSTSSSDLDDDEEEEEEDEGELDLERLLVPARRQASIRSLRKHLHPVSATGSLRGVLPTSPSTSTNTSTNTINDRLSPFAPDAPRPIWLNDSWGTGRGRRWVVGEEDDDDGDGYGYGNGAFAAEVGTGRSGTRAGMKRRRGLPGSWAQWGG